MRPYASDALSLARRLGVPVACTWGTIDLINHDDPLAVGGFGTHGTRAANFAVQNADILIVLGCRLDTKATGIPSDFARAAKIVMVDIDQAEIDKMPKVGRPIDIGLCMDAGDFIKELSSLTLAMSAHDLNNSTWIYPQWDAWKTRIRGWRQMYVPRGQPYDLMNEIARHTNENDIIVSDTGNTLGWIMQGFPFKGERFIHAFNFTPMGYGLAGAVGAAFSGGRRVIAIVGDGGALMSINELATIARWNLDIHIILLNNHGHRMCVHTEDQWFNSKNCATTEESGLGFPNFSATASAFGIGIGEGLGSLRLSGPMFHEIEIDPNARLASQARYGFPIEDSEPSLSREEFKQQMIVETL